MCESAECTMYFCNVCVLFCKCNECASSPFLLMLSPFCTISSQNIEQTHLHIHYSSPNVCVCVCLSCHRRNTTIHKRKATTVYEVPTNMLILQYFFLFLFCIRHTLFEGCFKFCLERFYTNAYTHCSLCAVKHLHT